MGWIIGFIVCMIAAGAFLCIAGVPWIGISLFVCACAGGMIYSIVYLTKIYREVHAVRLALKKEQAKVLQTETTAKDTE